MELTERPKEACFLLAGRYYPLVPLDQLHWSESAAISAFMPWHEFEAAMVQEDPDKGDPRAMLCLAWVAIHRHLPKETIESLGELPVVGGFELLLPLSDEDAEGNEEAADEPSASSDSLLEPLTIPESSGSTGLVDVPVNSGGQA
jgi:hypothetical protein